jgi:hypothetical protein
MGAEGTGPGEFGDAPGASGPGALALDRMRRRLYAADQAGSRVHVFDADRGTLLGAFGSAGAGTGELGGDVGLEVDPESGEIYVADTWNERVQVFGPDLEPRRSWSAGLLQPTDVAIDRHGLVYVTDAEAHHVVKATSQGDVLALIGGPGAGPGQLDTPFGLAVDAAGNLHVADSGNERIQVFAPNGNALFAWGGLGSSTEVGVPMGVDVDVHGRPLVADYVNSRVLVFGSSFTYCESCGSGRCAAGSSSCCEIECETDDDCHGGICSPGHGACVPAPRQSALDSEGFFPVLSRSRGGLFAVGGEDATSGEPTGEIWFTSLTGRAEWLLVPTTMSPEHVLAATYSFVDDSLYVLDELDGATRRLWKLDLATYDAEILASYTSHAEWDEHHLVLDRDGALLVASTRTAPAASDTTTRYVITRIDVSTSSPRVDGREVGTRRLVLHPVVDGKGYTLLLYGDVEGTATDRFRKRELTLAPAVLADLQEQM